MTSLEPDFGPSIGGTLVTIKGTESSIERIETLYIKNNETELCETIERFVLRFSILKADRYISDILIEEWFTRNVGSKQMQYRLETTVY